MKAKRVRRQILDGRIWYICPKCGKPLIFRKRVHGKNLCIQCGQTLDWTEVDDIPSIWIQANDAESAAFWIGKYEAMHGTLYGLDETEYLKRQKSYPTLLYFSFPDGAGYGAFMRLASKEKAVAKDVTRVEHAL